MKKAIILIFLLFNFPFCTYAEILCTDPFSAEDSASNISNWEEAYKSYRKYKNCDDGSIAEGYSESIAKLLAFKWKEIGALKQIIKTDSNFFLFVLKHIDATTSNQDLILNNAKTLCEEGSETLCKQIAEEAKKALNEYR